MEDAVATIAGKTKEEVTVIAHICHPQPSANDNASGTGAAMEAARAIHRLIERKELPPTTSNNPVHTRPRDGGYIPLAR